MALFGAALLIVGCGSPRRVVVEPAAVPGLKADSWHVTGEPAAARPADDDTDSRP